MIFCFQILGKLRLMGDLSPEVEAGLGNLLRLYHKKAGKWREKKHRQEEKGVCWVRWLCPLSTWSL